MVCPVMSQVIMRCRHEGRVYTTNKLKNISYFTDICSPYTAPTESHGGSNNKKMRNILEFISNVDAT